MSKTDPREIPIIIPSYEPDEKLLQLLSDLKEKGFSKIVIVDDGSGKEYQHFFEKAQEKFGCFVMHHAVNLGKGRALKTAFDFVLGKFQDSVGSITAVSYTHLTLPTKA